MTYCAAIMVNARTTIASVATGSSDHSIHCPRPAMIRARPGMSTAKFQKTNSAQPKHRLVTGLPASRGTAW
jgi:hypothetical protein